MARIGTEEGLETSFHTVLYVEPVVFSPEIVQCIESAAREAGCRYRQIRSGVGHDAMYMQQLAPTGMIFVPSRGGRSHCADEDVDWADIDQAVNVLASSVLHLSEAGAAPA